MKLTKRGEHALCALIGPGVVLRVGGGGVSVPQRTDGDGVAATSCERCSCPDERGGIVPAAAPRPRPATKKYATPQNALRAAPGDGFLAGLLGGLASLSPQPTKP